MVTPAVSRSKLPHSQATPQALPYPGEEEQNGARATPGYAGRVAMTSAYLSPYDAPGQASAMKRAATGGDARFGEDDEGDRKPKAMPPRALEGGNPMNPSAYGTGARGDLSPMSDATQLFTGRRGEAGRDDVNSEDLKAPASPVITQVNTGGPGHALSLREQRHGHLRGPGRKGARFCVKTQALCGYPHKPKLKLAAGFYIKAPSGRRGLEAASSTHT